MTDGLLDLAEVTVRVAKSTADRVLVDLVPPTDGYPPADDWVRAATRGAEQALSELGRSRPGRRPLAVTLTRILGTVSDTRPVAVQCATGLAVWRAAAGDGSEPDIRYGRNLHLTFPPASLDERTLA